MSRLWEHEPRRGRLRRRRQRFTQEAQTSGFQNLVRDSLVSRGLDPDAMANLVAPPVVTKPVDRETIRQVVPEKDVRTTARALAPKPQPLVKVTPPEDRPSRGILGKLKEAAGDVLSAAPVREVLSILDILDVPRREVGKPIARVLLEPLALATEAADALSPDNLSALPRIFPTGGQIRGATAVEVMSFITDPLNVLMFAGPAIKAAKAATLGTRLTLKETQLLRKAVPTARKLLAEEAGGGPLRGSAERALSLTEAELRAMDIDSLQGVSDVLGIGRTKATSADEMITAIVERQRIAGASRARLVPGAVTREQLEVMDRGELSALANHLGIGARDMSRKQTVKAILRHQGGEAGGGLLGGQAAGAIAEVVEALPVRGRALTGSQAAAKLRGRDLPGTRTLTKAEIIKESPEIKATRAKVTGQGRNPPPPPPPRLPGEPPGLLPGDQAPSMSLWRTIESGLFLSPRASDLMRKTAETVGNAPAIKLFMKALTGPAALARMIPEMRAGVVYRQLQGVMDAGLGQRLVGQEEAFYKIFTLGRDRSKVIVNGKELAFGDYASNVLKGPRIGAKQGKFAATPAQREWIETQKVLMDDLARQYEHISEEELRLIDDYWPRFVQGDDGRVTIKGRIGAKQSPVKDRLFPEMEDAINRGVAYAAPFETVQLYGRAIQKMMRDKMLIQVIKEDKIGRPVMQQLKQEIKAIKSQIKAAPTTTTAERLEVEVLKNKVSNLHAIRASKKRSLVPAKQVLGPGFGRDMLEPEAAKVMQDIIGPGIGGKVGKGLRFATLVASIPRFIVTGAMDVGQFFIQGATLLATNPGAWSRTVGHSLISLFSPEHWTNFLKNSPEAIEAARYGIGRGGIEFLEITKRSAALGRAPGAGVLKAVFGAAPRSFETFIEGSRIFNFNSLARVQKAGRGAAKGVAASEIEGELFRIANYVKTKLGTTDLMGLGLSVTQRQVESAFLLYSPRYTRSVFGMLGWAMSKGVPARDAQRALGTMLFGGLSAFYGFARATGLSHEEAISRIDPRSGGKFLSLPMGGNEYGFGSSYRATLGFLGQLIKEDNLDLSTWTSTDNPIYKYLRSRTAPTTGTLIDFIEGEDFIGKEVDLNAFIDDPGRMLDYATGKFLPLNLEALFEARGPLEQRMLASLTETVGGRSFPRSSFAIFQEAQESVFQEKRIMGEEPYTDFDSFQAMSEENAPAVAVINTDPRVQQAQERLEHESRYRKVTTEGVGFKKLEETRTVQEQLQLEDDVDFNNGEMAVSIWKDSFRNRQGEFFARRDQIVADFGLKFGKDKAGVNAAIDAYFSVEGENYKNLLTGGVDWDRFFAARDATLEGLSPANFKLVKDYLRRYDTPTVRAFRKAQSDLDEYWAIEDLAWDRLRRDEEFKPFLNLNDYLASKMQSLLDSGVPQDEVSQTLVQLPVISSVTSTVAKLRNRYRLTHPSADALLEKWYGLSPAKPQRSLSRTGRGQR